MILHLHLGGKIEFLKHNNNGLRYKILRINLLICESAIGKKKMFTIRITRNHKNNEWDQFFYPQEKINFYHKFSFPINKHLLTHFTIDS